MRKSENLQEAGTMMENRGRKRNLKVYNITPKAF